MSEMQHSDLFGLEILLSGAVTQGTVPEDPERDLKARYEMATL